LERPYRRGTDQFLKPQNQTANGEEGVGGGAKKKKKKKKKKKNV
jgi:hypothetical protein